MDKRLAVVMPLEFIVPSLRITLINEMTDIGAIEERLLQLVQLEDRFIVGYHQFAEERHNAWHDCHIMFKQFQVGDFVLLFDGKFSKHPGKLRTHWLGPYVVIRITDGGAVELKKLDGTPFNVLVNGSWLKPYQDSHNSLDYKDSDKKKFEV